MTKAEELQRYDEFVRGLPEASYLRPWLSQIRDQVADAIRCDHFPEFTPQETLRHCEQLKREAAVELERHRERHMEATDRMVKAEQDKARQIIARAEREAEDIRQSLRDDLARLRTAMNSIA